MPTITTKSYTFETISLLLPAYWACYLINGDSSYLDDPEIAQIEACLARENVGLCMGTSPGPADDLGYGDDDNFTAWHDARPEGVLPGNCVAYTFEVAGSYRA